MGSGFFPAFLLLLCALALAGSGAAHRSSRRLPTYPSNVTEIILGYGYPCEEYTVQTDDGFLLSLQRIPYGRQSASPVGRPVVFLQHGLLDSSVGWTLNPPHESLAFILADNGFDVWLGNDRGSLYALKNTQYNTSDAEFWDWSFDEMARYDFPALVDFALNQTGASTLSYIAHSQGTMQAFAALQVHPGYAARLNVYIALAPMAYMGNIKSWLLSTLAELETEELFALLGFTEFYPSSSAVIKDLLPVVCGIIPELCSDFVALIFGPSSNLNLTRSSYYTHYEPNPTSVKNIVHIAQLIRTGKWQMFDYGASGNQKKYNSTTPPQYSLRAFPPSVPIALFYGGNDDLADVIDVKYMIQQLPDSFPYPPFVHFEPLYAHLDPLLDMEAYIKIYPDVLTLLRTHGQAPTRPPPKQV